MSTGRANWLGRGRWWRAAPGIIIFRTSWVYGARGKNFLLTILKLARERETLRVVADQYGAPTWSRDLAKMTAEVIGQCEAEARGCELATVLGRYRRGLSRGGCRGDDLAWVCGGGGAVAASRREPACAFAKIEAITTAEYPTPAKRPANSRMNCEKLRERFGWKMMDWQDSLREVLAEL